MSGRNERGADMVELNIAISRKAYDLITEYSKTTGYGVKDRVVEELAFAVYELLKIDKERNISLEEFRGVLKTFRRFEGKE